MFVQITCEPSTATMQALYTISFEGVAICIDLPLTQAMAYLRDWCKEQESFDNDTDDDI